MIEPFYKMKKEELLETFYDNEIDLEELIKYKCKKAKMERLLIK